MPRASVDKQTRIASATKKAWISGAAYGSFAQDFTSQIHGVFMKTSRDAEIHKRGAR
jgi:hypothetical protein